MITQLPWDNSRFLPSLTDWKALLIISHFPLNMCLLLKSLPPLYLLTNNKRKYHRFIDTLYKSKQKLAINSLYSCGYKKTQIPLGLIDKTWHLSYFHDDVQQTLWQRETAGKVGSLKGEGNTAIKNKRIMILKGIIVVTTPLTFCFKLLNVWSFSEV